MIYQVGGVFIFICALAAIGVYTILRSRKPDANEDRRVPFCQIFERAIPEGFGCFVPLGHDVFGKK